MKKIVNIIILVLILCSISTCVNARLDYEYEERDERLKQSQSSSTHTAGEIIDEAGSFIDLGKQNADSKIDPTDLKNMSDTLYNILLVVAIIAALIVGLIMGIKFLLGSLEEKADIKTMVIPYIIGCVVAFGAFSIWQIVVNLLQTL